MNELQLGSPFWFTSVVGAKFESVSLPKIWGRSPEFKLISDLTASAAVSRRRLKPLSYRRVHGPISGMPGWSFDAFVEPNYTPYGPGPIGCPNAYIWIKTQDFPVSCSYVIVGGGAKENTLSHASNSFAIMAFADPFASGGPGGPCTTPDAASEAVGVPPPGHTSLYAAGSAAHSPEVQTTGMFHAVCAADAFCDGRLRGGRLLSSRGYVN